MRPDFTQCMVSNSRMAARAITRRYDASVRPFGITATQLSVMGMIISARGRNVSELAEARGFERTTLTRNIDRLERMGLIVSQPAAHGNARFDLHSRLDSRAGSKENLRAHVAPRRIFVQ